MAPLEETDEEEFDDPIRLVDVEQNNSHKPSNDKGSNSDTIFEATDAEGDVYIEKNNSVKVSLSLQQNISRIAELIKQCKPFTIKLVDIEKTNKITKIASDTDEEVNQYTKKTEDNKMTDENKIKIRPVVSPYQNLVDSQNSNSVQKIRKHSLGRQNSSKENQCDSFILEKESHSQVDFKKNRGLIGMKITQTPELSLKDKRKTKPEENSKSNNISNKTKIFKKKIEKKDSYGSKPDKKVESTNKDINFMNPQETFLVDVQQSTNQKLNNIKKTISLNKKTKKKEKVALNLEDNNNTTLTKNNSTVTDEKLSNILDVIKETDQKSVKVVDISIKSNPDINKVVEKWHADDEKRSHVILTKSSIPKVHEKHQPEIVSRIVEQKTSNQVSSPKCISNLKIGGAKLTSNKKTIDSGDDIVQSVFFSENQTQATPTLKSTKNAQELNNSYSSKLQGLKLLVTKNDIKSTSSNNMSEDNNNISIKIQKGKKKVDKVKQNLIKKNVSKKKKTENLEKTVLTNLSSSNTPKELFLVAEEDDARKKLPKARSKKCKTKVDKSNFDIVSSSAAVSKKLKEQNRNLNKESKIILSGDYKKKEVQPGNTTKINLLANEIVNSISMEQNLKGYKKNPDFSEPSNTKRKAAEYLSPSVGNQSSSFYIDMYEKIMQNAASALVRSGNVACSKTETPVEKNIQLKDIPAKAENKNTEKNNIYSENVPVKPSLTDNTSALVTVNPTSSSSASTIVKPISTAVAHSALTNLESTLAATCVTKDAPLLNNQVTSFISSDRSIPLNIPQEQMKRPRIIKVLTPGMTEKNCIPANVKKNVQSNNPSRFPFNGHNIHNQNQTNNNCIRPMSTNVQADYYLQPSNSQYEILPPTCDIAMFKTVPKSVPPNPNAHNMQNAQLSAPVTFQPVMRNLADRRQQFLIADPRNQSTPNCTRLYKAVPRAQAISNLNKQINLNLEMCQNIQHFPPNLQSAQIHPQRTYGPNFQQTYTNFNDAKQKAQKAPIYESMPTNNNSLRPTSYEMSNHWGGIYNPLMPPPPPPPPPPQQYYIGNLQVPEQCTNQTFTPHRHNIHHQKTCQQINNAISKPKTISGTTVIGCNDNGLIRKINLIREPVNKPDKIPCAKLPEQAQFEKNRNNEIKSKNYSSFDQKNVKNTGQEESYKKNNISQPTDGKKEVSGDGQIVCSKTLMLKELSKATIEISKTSPVKDLKRPLSKTDIKEITKPLDIIKRPKPGPLSKKPRGYVIEDTSPMTYNGYSPPILPIPTYEKTLELLAKSNMTNTLLTEPTGSEIERNVMNPPFVSNVVNGTREPFNEKYDKLAKKISLDEYKRRAFKPEDENIIDKNNIKMEMKTEFAEDLGYGSDSTIRSSV